MDRLERLEILRTLTTDKGERRKLTAQINAARYLRKHPQPRLDPDELAVRRRLQGERASDAYYERKARERLAAQD